MIHVTTDDFTLRRVQHDAMMVPLEPAIFRVEGPGALTCLQGLLTNDLDKPGPGSLVYGALLTPKGMIVLDLWTIRDTEGFTLVVPVTARQAALDLFRKSLPPRLARVADLTGEATALWLLGGAVAIHAAAAGIGTLPEGGRAETRKVAGHPIALASGPPAAWFRGLVIGGAEAMASVLRNLSAQGVVEGNETVVHAARILAGWPSLGAEIGEKTLPQEVRFDEIGGVSYTKGCYTGQETVARVHFRGHPNRELRGLVWDSMAPLSGTAVSTDERDAGQVGSIVETPSRRFGLAVLRREVLAGERVTAAGVPATVSALPFPAEMQMA